MKLYVGNLPYNISDDQLRDMFAKYGVPDSARVITDRDFRDLTFVNPVRLHAGPNPRFFDGTVCEAAATQALADVGSRLAIACE